MSAGPFTHARSLGFVGLLMIAVISVDSIRNLPINAQYGTSLLFFYAVAVITFFIPLIYITSKLAARYPNTGGSYLWVQTAFGPRWGFVSIWLQWIYNMIWYPTIFAFISTTMAAMINPHWENSEIFILLASLAMFWVVTAISCRGIHAVSWFSIVCAILGTIVPMLLIMALAFYWLFTGHASAVPLHWQAAIPHNTSLLNLTFYANILFSLLGIDVIGIHAGDVKNPSRTYPRVLTIAGITIVVTLVLSTLALCIVVPPQKIGLISGLMDGFALFFNQYHLSWGIPFIGFAIILGSLGVASSWMIGLARGLHVASFASALPVVLQKQNRYQMPYVVLLAQAVIFTLLLSVFMVFPNINNSYWMLSAMTAQFALLYYILLFSAAIKLLRQEHKSPAWIILPIAASLSSLAGIIVGFLPSTSIVGAGAILRYEILLCGGGLAFFLPLVFFLRRHKAA